MKTPVVFLVFNRPEPVRRVFERIRQARPQQLLVVCDGPRPHVPTDAQRVAEVRNIIEKSVDWPCELLTNYAEKNMGCRERVNSGLDWAFSLVEEAIILEDDCLPSLSFFPYCEALLERYRNEPRVMHIGANNFQGWRRRTVRSYFFSKYNHIWGWATWRRAWQLSDKEGACWKNPVQRAQIETLFDSPEERAYWSPIFDSLTSPESRPNTWDYSWMLTCWAHGGLAAYPSVNLVENIGFGADATHTQDASARQVPAQSIRHLSFARKVVRNTAADRHTFRTVFLLRAAFPQNIWNHARIVGGRFKKLLRKAFPFS
ncbi:MAG: glycosyltransferase family 2 protein [Verrucomicrobia bacterium]|nr:glycosyltransferase family 2 protein [Verrucomicrobiota bacterium]